MTHRAWLLLATLAWGLTSPWAGAASADRTEGYNALRNPYFGQTHQHTG